MSLLAAFLLATVLADAPARITPAGFVGKEPQVAASGARVFVACGNGDALYVLRSGDGGASFADPVPLPTRGKARARDAQGSENRLAGKAVVVSAVYGAQGGGQDGELVSWRSLDEGRTWKGPARGKRCPGRGSRRPPCNGSVPGRNPGLRLARSPGQGTEIYVSTSKDGGASWSKNVSAYRSPSGTVCECCHPSVAYGPSGSLYVMFRNWLGGSRDMYLTSSTDGKAFSAAQKLGNGTWPLNACPMDGGALSVRTDGTVETVWRRGGKVYACVPGQPERELGSGDQPWVATIASQALPVWVGEDGIIRGNGNVSLTRGVDPVVAAVGGRGLAVWADRSGRIWTQPFR